MMNKLYKEYLKAKAAEKKRKLTPTEEWIKARNAEIFKKWFERKEKK